MPSLRALCAARNLSKSTVLSAYGQLEAEGLLESRPRSGYFVRLDSQQALSAPVPRRSDPEIIPVLVSTEQVVIDIMEKGAAFDLLTGDENDPQKNKKTNVELRRCLARAHRHQTGYDQNYYNPPQGAQLLREQIVTRLHSAGSHLEADDIAITSGCQNSLLLALMATTRPGDVVAIESPGFYGAIQLLEALGLQILELASDPVTGVNVDLLAVALERWEVSALIVSPSYSTPTGACMSEASMQAILALCLGHGVAIIEDDIYRELHFDIDSPRTLHSYDDTGSVLLCSSFSKALSRDLRIGWIAPGKYKEQRNAQSRIEFSWSRALRSYHRF